MRILTLTLALIMSGGAWAQVGGLLDADIREVNSTEDPATAVANADNQWLVFSIPVVSGTRSMCCWQGQWSDDREVGCSLEQKHHSFGTRRDLPLTDTVMVYSEIQKGEVAFMMVVGEQCPVEGKGKQVNWLGTVDSKAGLNFLEDVARSKGGRSASESALYALALHQSNEASTRLSNMAKETDGERAEEAIFWLGHARGEDGFNALEQLLVDLPAGEPRRQINFALTQNDSKQAADLLIEISKTDRDPEQRSDALFWLAQEYPEQAEPLLLDVIKQENNKEVLQQAVFAISQLPGTTGTELLLNLAKDPEYSDAVRRQALFWLAQSDDEDAVDALAGLLTQ
jgi:hypothetical protein